VVLYQGMTKDYLKPSNKTPNKAFVESVIAKTRQDNQYQIIFAEFSEGSQE